MYDFLKMILIIKLDDLIKLNNKIFMNISSLRITNNTLH